MLSWFRPLTGWHVLAIIVAFFSVTIGVNIVFISFAVSTHPGEDVPRSYMQGVNYNQTLERRQQQGEMGWQARFNTVDGELLIEVRDRTEDAVTGLMLEGTLVHQADTTRDSELQFEERRSGLYVASLPQDAAGQWRLRARNAGELPFEVEQDLWLP